jgi:hypothetical protein
VPCGKTGPLATKVRQAVDEVRAARTRSAGRPRQKKPRSRKPPAPRPKAGVRAIQAAFAWAPDFADGKRGPDQIAWAPAGRALTFEPGKVYILALQVAMKTGCRGAWFLQYQQDYDKAEPGEWTNVTNRGVWKTTSKRNLSLRNARQVDPRWYSMPVVAGYRAAAGEFSDDNNGLVDNYRKGDCVELWYAIRAEESAAGHSYRFRVYLKGVPIEGRSYPLATPAAD